MLNEGKQSILFSGLISCENEMACTPAAPWHFLTFPKIVLQSARCLAEDDGALAQFCLNAGAPLPCAQERAEHRPSLYMVLGKHSWVKAAFANLPFDLAQDPNIFMC